MLDAKSKDDLITKMEELCNQLCNYSMNQMTYELYKPWEVSLAIIEIARNLCGFRKQQIKIW
jgi:hypothetical protein